MCNINFNLKNNVEKELNFNLKGLKIKQIRENLRSEIYMNKAISSIADKIIKI